MNAGLQGLVKRITPRCDLPPLPRIAARALALAADPNARIAVVARVVEADPILTVRVLKIAGSVTYARREPVRNLETAIMSLGFHALRRVLIAASAAAVYRVDAAMAEALWTHALLTAFAADELGVLDGRPRGGSEFLAGLLHDIGRLVLHLTDPAMPLDLADGADEFEQGHFGATHAEVGAYVAQQWGLEHQVVEGILTHHHPRFEFAKRLAAAECVAEEAAQALGEVCAGSGDGTLTLVATVRERFQADRALFD